MTASDQPKPNPDTPLEDDADQLVLTSPDAASTPRDFALWAGVLFLLTLAAYGPALRGSFLWDDDRHVTRNVSLRTLDGLRRIWFEPPLGGGSREVSRVPPQYYPLTHTTYWIEYQLFGPDEQGNLNTIVFHVTNGLLHAGAATLLWFILRRLSVPAAWLAAAVFALHPMNVESVAWITERKNVLSAAFMFASILVYLKFERVGDDYDDDPPRERKPDMYALSLALFLCALLSKTVACSMPAVMVLLLWWKRGRVRWGDVAPLVPFFIIGAAMAALTGYIERTHVIGPHYASGDWDLSRPQRIVIAGHALWFYAYKLLVPYKLTFTYPRWDVDPGDVTQWIAPAAAVIVLVGLWFARNRIGRGTVAAVYIVCGVLTPALGFFDVYPMRYSFVADHFAYHASPALIALVVAAAVTLLRPLFRAETVAPDAPPGGSPTPYVVSGAVLLALAILTWRQAGVYADEVTLWEDTVAKNPDAWMAHYNLGTALSQTANVNEQLGNPEAASEQRDQAVKHFARTIELRPEHDGARNNWGETLFRQKKFDEALAQFRDAVAKNPKNVEARQNIGAVLQATSKPDEALAAYREALAVCESQTPPQPARCGLIHYVIGDLLESKGDLDGALAAFAEAVRSRPNDVRARYAYGMLLARKEKRPEAAQQFAAIIRRSPDHVDARTSLGLLQLEVGNLPDAQMNLHWALRVIKASGAAPPPRLVEAIKMFDAAFKQLETTTRAATTQAATRSTTRPATAPATNVTVP